MITLSIKEDGDTVSALLKKRFHRKAIRFCQSSSSSDCDYIFLPKDALHSDILVIHGPCSKQQGRGDYITLLNTDEKITADIDKKSLLITYGLNPLATVTASSMKEEAGKTVFSCCLQRSIVTLKGKIIEPQEFPVALKAPQAKLCDLLAFVSLGLVLSFTPDDFL